MSTSISLTVISFSFTRLAAASGQTSLNGMILPAALYFWQLPHFMALAYLCRKDYADGGSRMFSLADASGQRTASVALRNCLYLLPLGYLAYDSAAQCRSHRRQLRCVIGAGTFTATSDESFPVV
ncbi:Protoheme IX farnesyltransferase, mitochondrial [Olea europaea subsp. europaea]|uniref:Protoheme IX farnesyltransferase, mitochondrial n=1 Tax=Olea europaea subsp. europaea TaxID=158383 RepID=A0A8S0S1A2_OLEEU|nr:Protoheme IX farnesyltransferase, mitochondrial [Olea europaea subsp. europaea]